MSHTQGDLLYEGKAKRVFKVKEDENLLWLSFKDSMTAFNGEKKEELIGKSEINAQITTIIFKYLHSKNIKTHWVKSINQHEMICQTLKMIPLEVVLRNVLAGSTAKKFTFKEGTELEKPLVEFFYKDDALNDPFISDEQALMLKTVDSQEDLNQLKALGLKVNEALIPFFKEVGVQLVDFKLEFGKDRNGQICLGDEISPDSCRLWDIETGEKMDKDRFRRNLGNVKENYEEILRRIKNRWGES